jgi:hypothetical protein
MSGMSANDEMWRSILTHVDSPLRRNRRMMKLLPAAHRCKLCNLPFSGPTAPMMRLTGHRRAKMNPQFCSLCEAMAESNPGGVELELTMLFGDIRGSTRLAESLGNATARFASAAGAGEILVSASTAQAAGLDTAQLEFRHLELKGRQQAMDVYVMGPAGVTVSL